MTIVTSTLRMKLDASDFTSNAAKLAASVQEDVRRIDQLKAALKESGASDRLQASMVKLGASTSHVEGMRQALEKMRQEMGITGVATGKLSEDQRKAIKAFESTTIAVVRSTIAEERNLTAAMARQAVEREAILKREAEREADARHRAGERRQADMKRLFEAETAMRRRQEQQVHAAQERGGIRHMVGTGAAAYVTAHGVAHVGREVLMQGSELQDTRLKMQRAGISPVMRVQMEQQALELSRRYANVGQIAIMDIGKDVRSVIKDQHEVFNATELLTAAKSVLDANGGHSDGLSMLIKGAESIGAGNDPVRLKKLINSYVRAIQVMGETINPEQIYQFDKYLKGAGATVSDRFLMTTGLSLSQEMGGSTAANDIFHAQKDIVGGFQNKHIPIKEMLRMGLIDPGDVEYTKTGEAKGIKAGRKGVAGADVAQTDLDTWVYKYFLPALEKHGLKDEKAQLAFVQKVFTGGESDVITKLIQQRESFQNHGEMFGQAMGTEGTSLNAESASVGLTALTTAIGNLAANVSVEAMAPIGRTLTGVADGLNVLAQAAKDHPMAAMVSGGAAGAAALAGSGYLSYKVLNGFGLGTAATALEGSAGALTLAAEKLGATGTVNKASVSPTPDKSGKPGIVDTAARLLMLQQAAEFAKDHHALDLPKRTGVAGAVEFLDPGLADRIYGRNLPEVRTKDDVYAAPRTSTLSPESYWDRKKAYLNRGFADGGFTGPGSRNEPAGIVHRGEYVVPASATTRHRALLDAIRRGDILPGYAQGGLVGGTGGVARVVLATDSSSTTALREVFGGAVYDALRRIRSEDGSLSGGSGGSGDGGSGGARSLRYGRSGDGTYRSTPGRYDGGGGHGGSGTVREGGHISGPSADSGRATRAGGSLARNQQEAYRAARAEGLSDVAARALVANMSGESLAKPNDYHYDRTHMSGGIVQWDPARSARIKEHFGKLPWQMSVTDQTRAAVWEMRTRPEYAATNRALQGTDPNAMIGTLVDNYERPQLREKAKRERLGYLHGFKPDAGATYADEGRRGFATGQREAERAVLPRRSEAATPERHAGGVNFDTSSLREGIDHIRTFKAELSSLKGGVRVAIDHTHTHKGEPGARPGALRTSLNGGYASDGRSWT